MIKESIQKLKRFLSESICKSEAEVLLWFALLLFVDKSQYDYVACPTVSFVNG